MQLVKNYKHLVGQLLSGSYTRRTVWLEESCIGRQGYPSSNTARA